MFSYTHLIHVVPSLARPHRAQWFVVVAECVHVKQPRCGEQHREHVAERHRHQDDVGGGPHVASWQHHHDQRVGDSGGREEEGRDVPAGQVKCDFDKK